MERLFLSRVRDAPAKTLFILTADHGQIAVDPSETIYLNLDSAFTGIRRYLRQNKENRYLIPGGSSRDMYLYLRPGCLEEAVAFLSPKLEGKAVVAQSSELIELGYFGEQPMSEAFLARVGDLVILPLGGNTVWWYERGYSEFRFRGHHGGLSAQEMFIPFLMLEL